MADDRAVINAELNNVGEVVSGAKKVSSTLRQAESDAKKTTDALTKGSSGGGAAVDGLSSKLKGLGANLGGIGRVAGAAGVAGFVAMTAKAVHQYLGDAAGAAKSFGDTTSSASRRAGLDLSTLRATVARNETATLHGADAQSDFVKTLAKTTYNGKGAMESLRSVGFAATASGRDLSELVPVVASIQDGLNVKGDVGDELARLGDLAQRLKTIGGPQALQDGIAALRPALQQINIAGAGARANVEALFAVLSQNRRPGAAQSVISGAIGMIKGRSTDVERTLKRNVIGDNGEIEKPMEVLEDLQKHLRNRYKGNKVAQRRAAIAEFGPELGTAVYSTDFSKVREEGLRSFGGSIVQLDPKTGEIADAQRLGPSSAEEETEAFKRTREGQRKSREAQSQRRKEEIGSSVLAYQDARDSVVEEAANLFHRNMGGALQAVTPKDMQSGLVRLDADSAKAIGKETADALRAVPPKVQLPTDPNTFKGN